MITFGFYNSVDHDRRYDAIQFGSVFDGIIRDGIFMSIGTCFRVIPMEDMSVLVGIGRAWFDHTWTLNDAPLVMEIPQSEILSDRIDAIVLDIDANPESRKNDIIVIKGIPSKTPQAPELINNPNHHQYPLAYISVEAGATSIRAADITSMIGTSQTPYVTGILDTVNIDALLDQWEDQWEEFYEIYADEMEEMKNTYALWKAEIEAWTTDYKNDMDEWQQQQGDEMEEMRTAQQEEFMEWKNEQQTEFTEWRDEQQTEFNEWFDDLQVMLEPDEAANLANGILGLQKNFKNLEKHAILDSSYTPIGDDSDDDGGNDNGGNDNNGGDTSNVNIFDVLDEIATVEMRRSIWRGKNLGSEVTEEQYNEIQNGTFKGLFLGDYWEMQRTNDIYPIKMQIVDFDYWYKTKATNKEVVNQHHVVIMPDTPIMYTAVDYESNNNNYYNTLLGNTMIIQAKDEIRDMFGATNYKIFLTRYERIDMSGDFVFTDVDIPTEPMIFGSYIFSSKSDYIYDNKQLSAFRICYELMRNANAANNNIGIWLRNRAEETGDFTMIDKSGRPSYDSKSNINAIRPIFGLVKPND